MAGLVEGNDPPPGRYRGVTWYTLRAGEDPAQAKAVDCGPEPRVFDVYEAAAELDVPPSAP